MQMLKILERLFRSFITCNCLRAPGSEAGAFKAAQLSGDHNQLDNIIIPSPEICFFRLPNAQRISIGLSWSDIPFQSERSLISVGPT